MSAPSQIPGAVCADGVEARLAFDLPKLPIDAPELLTVNDGSIDAACGGGDGSIDAAASLHKCVASAEALVAQVAGIETVVGMKDACSPLLSVVRELRRDSNVLFEALHRLDIDRNHMTVVGTGSSSLCLRHSSANELVASDSKPTEGGRRSLMSGLQTTRRLSTLALDSLRSSMYGDSIEENDDVRVGIIVGGAAETPRVLSLATIGSLCCGERAAGRIRNTLARRRELWTFWTAVLAILYNVVDAVQGLEFLMVLSGFLATCTVLCPLVLMLRRRLVAELLQIPYVLAMLVSAIGVSAISIYHVGGDLWRMVTYVFVSASTNILLCFSDAQSPWVRRCMGRYVMPVVIGIKLYDIISLRFNVEDHYRNKTILVSRAGGYVQVSSLFVLGQMQMNLILLLGNVTYMAWRYPSSLACIRSRNHLFHVSPGQSPAVMQTVSTVTARLKDITSKLEQA